MTVVLLTCAILQHGQLCAQVKEEGAWRLVRTSSFKYGSGKRPTTLKLRLYWGDQRMGLLQIDAVRWDEKSKHQHVKEVYRGIRSWNWCALMHRDGSKPVVLVNGYWDVQSPPETTILEAKGDLLVPLAKAYKIANQRSLEAACFAYIKNRKRFPCIEAYRVNGAWELKDGSR